MPENTFFTISDNSGGNSGSGGGGGYAGGGVSRKKALSVYIKNYFIFNKRNMFEKEDYNSFF